MCLPPPSNNMKVWFLVFYANPTNQSCTSSSVLLVLIAALWPVMAEGTWSWQRHFQETPSRDRDSSVREKRVDCNDNFSMTINLQSGIRALSPRGCALLLYSISQLLPAITVNPHCPPHTKPLLHYLPSGAVQTAKTYDGLPWELCFLRAWEGLFLRRGPSAGPLCICSLAWAAVTPWGPLIFFSITLRPPPV